MTQQSYPPLSAIDQHLPGFSSNGFAHAFRDDSARGPVDPYGAPQDDQAQGSINASQTPQRDSGGGNRTNRLRKACDSCSIRKVKCDEAGPPCRACAALDIPCTYERPSRRRGPPNKHAEAIKRQRMESQQRQSSPYATAPPTPSYPIAAPQSNTVPAILCADSICPIELVQLLIDDFFTYVHPLCPFPHEPTFREDFRQRKDISDRPFLALLASMIGALIAQFPRRPRKHMREMGRLNLFRNSNEFVDHCGKIIGEARGLSYLDRHDLGVYDAATSYFLVCMNSHVYKWRQCDLYLGECFSIIRALGFYSPRPAYPPMDIGSTGILGGEYTNFIEEEMGRRLYWIIFVTVRSARTFDVSMGEMPIRPPTPTQGYPPLPAEVDDQCLHATHIEHQPHGVVSKMTAFNANVRIYRTLDPLIALEAAYGVDQYFDVERNKRVLRDAINRVKHIVDSSPEELLVWPSITSRSPSMASSIKNEHDPGPLTQVAPSVFFTSQYAQDRRRIWYEIQKANIHVSYLSTRSYLLERLWALVEGTTSGLINNAQGQAQQGASSPSAFAYRSTGGATPMPHGSPNSSTSSSSSLSTEIRAERQSIACDLLQVLSHIRPVHMEPNSVSFCMKVRAISSTLLPEPHNISNSGAGVAGGDDELSGGGASGAGGAGQGGGGVMMGYLRSFLDILMELEKSRGPPGSVDGAAGDWNDVGDAGEEDEVDLGRWAGMREYQRQFAGKDGQ